MNEKVLVTLRKQKWEVEPGQTARQILAALDVPAENVILIRNDEIVDEETLLRAGDHLRLAVIISGGSQER
jgi:sulfur carrier protein ThiS